MSGELNSVNPVFVNFNTLSEDVTVTLKIGESAAAEQKGAEILEKLSANGAKMGYGIGYAGTTQAIAGNISYDGPDVPFADAMNGVKWGRAILCVADKSTPGTIALTALDPDHITGVCYGTTIKDSSVQLNAAIAVANGVSDDAIPVASSAESALVLAIMCNASIDGEGVLSEEGETVVAMSEAIDPTVINAPSGLQFQIPDATGGYTFTVRGTLAKAPFVRRVSNYTSMKDRVSSFPTSQAILDAKVNAGE